MATHDAVLNPLGAPVLAAPTGGADYHLLLTVGAAGAGRSLLYAPLDEAPGLTTDVIRCDRLTRTSGTLLRVAEQWRANLAAYVAPVPIAFETVRVGDVDAVFHGSFRGHPILGGGHTAIRYVRTDHDDFAVQTIRKLEAPTKAEVARRIAFLEGAVVAGTLPDAASVQWTSFARAAQARSAELAAWTQALARTRRNERTLDELAALLATASPFEDAASWANAATFFGREVLGEGRIDLLETAVRCLGLALLTLHDLRGEPELDRIRDGAIDCLAELLLLRATPRRSADLSRSRALFHLVAAGRAAEDPQAALRADVLAALAAALVDVDGAAPLDAGLRPQARRVIAHAQPAQLGADALLDASLRIAYVARRQDRALFRDAAVAGDFAQRLLERATLEGGLGFEALMQGLVQAFDVQLGAQRGLYGLSQADLDAGTRAFAARFRTEVEPPMLLFLRPLASSKRGRLPNAFGPFYRPLLDTLVGVPHTLTIEAALHIAFMMRFNTTALGGPIDLLGMARGTAVIEATDAPLRTWQRAALTLIDGARVVLMLLDDSEGLLWELTQIGQRGAAGRLVLVDAGVAAGAAAARAPGDALRRAGFHVPAGAGSRGFLLFDDGARLEEELPFDALWSGALLERVTARTAERV